MSRPDPDSCVVDGNIHGTASLYACDVDNDSDLDILGASMEEHTIDWWRNDGGFPVQWTEQPIDTEFAGAKSVQVADFDGDSVLDVVGAALFDNDVTWWRNDGGNPIQWTEYLIAGNFYGAHRVQPIDIDLDGRVDVLGAAYYCNTIAWWRNNGGNPVTWTVQFIGTGFAGACIAQGVDLDADNDTDVVATAQIGNEVAWWRNDGGSPIQWTKFVIDSLARAWPLFCCDLDQDGDTDIIAGSSWNGSNEVKWYENQGTAIAEDKQKILQPHVSSMIIRGDIVLPEGNTCRLFNINGRRVSPRGLPSGIYYLVIDGTVRTRIVKLK